MIFPLVPRASDWLWSNDFNSLTYYLNRLEKKAVTKDDRVATLEKEIMKRKAMLREINATLPKQNSLYLRIILGNVNVSILNKNDK